MNTKGARSTTIRDSKPMLPTRKLRSVSFSHESPDAQAPPAFAASGVKAQHVVLPGVSSFDFCWHGNLHYLALHDLHLVDGETHTDKGTAGRAHDLRGSLTFIPAGCRAWGWSAPTNRSNSFTALYFNPTQIDADLGDRLNRMSLEPAVYFTDGRLRQTMEKIRSALTRSGELDRLQLELMCSLALIELFDSRSTERHGSASSDRALSVRSEREIRDYVEANLHADISITDLASLAGLSRFHFIRAFKESLNATPYQFVIRRRMERAQDLLASKDKGIAEIGREVGFKDAARFVQSFRRFAGMTPGRYREEIRSR